MSFVSPLWWWALAGLAVPLAIHLLSRGRRLRVAIGTVRHLAGSESRALRRLRLTGWRQLLVRLALLAALALALAGPRWPPIGSRGSTGDWLFIDPELLALELGAGLPDNDFSRALQESREKATSIRLLSPGLPEVGGGEAQSASADAWSLLREADEMAPAGTPFSVFTLDRVGWLHGRRPAIGRSVDWRILPDPEPNRWIQRAVSLPDDTRVVTLGESTALATRFNTVSWTGAQRPPDGAGLREDAGTEVLGLVTADRRPEDDSVSVPAEPPAIRVALTAGADRATDAWYLRQALTAVGSFLDRELRWTEEGASPVDLEIHLGADSTAGTASPLLIRDSDSSFEPCQGWVHTGSMSGDPWLRLEKCFTRWEPAVGVAQWVDNWGRPFLSRRSVGQMAVYELHGRFDTRGSSLVTSPVLPHLLLELVAPGNSSAGGASTSLSDRRSTTGLERLPGSAVPSSAEEDEESALPEILSWLLVIMLLVLERLISGRLS